MQVGHTISELSCVASNYAFISSTLCGVPVIMATFQSDLHISFYV